MRTKINSLPIKDIQTEENLLIRIADNGKGINKAYRCQFGNGLKKIAKRMESIGGILRS